MKFTPILRHGRSLRVFTAGGTWSPPPPGQPSELALGGERWVLLWHTSMYSRRAKGARIVGLAHHAERIVMVDPEQAHHEIRGTIMHEALHVLLSHARQRDPLVRRMRRDLEEALCCALEGPLAGLVL